jgi:hypothetical protein
MAEIRQEQADKRADFVQRWLNLNFSTDEMHHVLEEYKERRGGRTQSLTFHHMLSLSSFRVRVAREWEKEGKFKKRVKIAVSMADSDPGKAVEAANPINLTTAFPLDKDFTMYLDLKPALLSLINTFGNDIALFQGLRSTHAKRGKNARTTGGPNRTVTEEELMTSRRAQDLVNLWDSHGFRSKDHGFEDFGRDTHTQLEQLFDEEYELPGESPILAQSTAIIVNFTNLLLDRV